MLDQKCRFHGFLSALRVRISNVARSRYDTALGTKSCRYLPITKNKNTPPTWCNNNNRYHLLHGTTNERKSIVSRKLNND